MGKKLSTIERHSRQKIKLQEEGAIQKPTAYVPEPLLKEKALAEAIKNKMNVGLVNHVLYFYVDSMDQLDEVRIWLSKRYGNPVPFSFGIKKVSDLNKNSVFPSSNWINNHDLETEETV